MRFTRIAGVGHYLPEKVVTNHDLEKLVETSDEWIQERSGIKERRFADEDMGCADLAERASRAALDDAGWSPDDVQFIIFATLSPDLPSKVSSAESTIESMVLRRCSVSMGAVL